MEILMNFYLQLTEISMGMVWIEAFDDFKNH